MSDWVKKEEAESTLNIDDLPTTTKLSHLHQEGNYLVGVSELGARFTQRIPAGKILTKIGEDFVLKERLRYG